MKKNIKKPMLCEEPIEIPESILMECLADDSKIAPNVLEQMNADLITSRVIFLDDMVNKSIMDIIKAVMYWNQKDAEIPVEERQPIKFYICSPGGDLVFMWALLDVILASKTPIYTINIGVAYSAAALLFLGGTKRYMLPHSNLMIHQGSAVLDGDYNKLQDAFKNYETRIGQVYDFILERCPLSEDLLREHAHDDWYFTADECLKNGICHSVITCLDDVK